MREVDLNELISRLHRRHIILYVYVLMYTTIGIDDIWGFFLIIIPLFSPVFRCSVPWKPCANEVYSTMTIIHCNLIATATKTNIHYVNTTGLP